MKTIRPLIASGAALLSTALLLAFAPAAQASTFPDLTYSVTLDLSQLANSVDSDAPYALDLQLVTGSGNQTNTVTLSNFVFTGGTATGTDFSAGNVSGSIASSLVLTSNSNPNTATDNEFAELFSAGVTQISFNVDQTPNSETVASGTATPEQFNVAILDNDLNNIPTTDPSGANTLLTSPLGSTSTASTVSQYAIVAAPEPTSGFLGCIAAGVMLGLLQLRRRFLA